MLSFLKINQGRKKYLIFIFFITAFFLLNTFSSIAQVSTSTVQISVTDQETRQNITDVSVILENIFEKYSSQTDSSGKSIFQNIPSGNYKITLSHLAYNILIKEIHITKEHSFSFQLHPKNIELNEIIITATESKGLTSTSIINKRAMQHLQPSSFTDLLELLPGGRSKDPVFNASNHIKLREVGSSDSNYDISSLGTSFIIDGIPINTDANLQYTTGPELIIGKGSGYADGRRNNTSKGVDMRSISTDQIEKVEIIRGIPSVEYGDLTSGVIKIKRKRGRTDWESRFKADGFSKLYYVGKGFELDEKNFILNIGLDYLNAKPDPRNSFENYKRITASVRSQKIWENNQYSLQWNANLDYSGSMDNEKVDPDTGYSRIDRYSSDYKRFAIANIFDLNFKSSSFLKTIHISTSLSQQYDKIKQTKWVQISNPTAIPNSTEQGEHDGIYLTPQYISELMVDGKPMDAYFKVTGDFKTRFLRISHAIKLGTEWNYAKNNGKGQVYDPTHPPTPEMTTRPRSYKDIPASQDIAFFAEDFINFRLGKHEFNLAAGIRSMSLLNLKSEYTIHGKYYFDPRFNAQWILPSIKIGKHALKTELTAGTGWYTKFPTLAQLYPDYIYNDLIQLNYYHNTPEYRRINLITYKNSPINYNLTPARNNKWEIRTDFSYDNNRLSVTYFEERLNSGFRTVSQYRALSYKKYDNNSIDHESITSQPNLNDMTFVIDTLLTAYGITNNGSLLLKSGIEFQFISKRFSSINTRFTINGAWFKSTYRNSAPVYKKGSKDVIINGKYYPYLGLYQWDSGSEKQQLNTNLTIDTYLPSLDLEFSSSFQLMWFNSNQSTKMNGTPISYIDPSGTLHPYTEQDKKDSILQWLNIQYNDSAFRKDTTPMSMNMNLKISKNFYKKLRISMFVNRILSYYKDYEINGQKINRRGLTSPYFGMELNLNF